MRLIHCGAPGLVDRVFVVHTGSRRFDAHRRHMPERFFRSNRPGYPHPVCSELENSGIRLTVGDCSVTERRRWCPPFISKWQNCTSARKNITNKRTTHGAGCARPWYMYRTAELLEERRYENWNTHTHTQSLSSHGIYAYMS